jgi:hypothetical protein
MPDMTDTEFDAALIAAAFRLAEEQGWLRVSVQAAALAGGLSLAVARGRFRTRLSILQRFGQLLDQAALTGMATEGPVRDRLFDLLMRRFDALQVNRGGVLALFRAVPCDPAAAMLLACEGQSSMRWMLQAAGVETTGILGTIRVRGLLAVWLWGVRAWRRDETQDLSTTMAAVDSALGRAESAAGWLQGRRDRPVVDKAPSAPDSGPSDSGPSDSGPSDSGPSDSGPSAALGQAGDPPGEPVPT